MKIMELLSPLSIRQGPVYLCFSLDIRISSTVYKMTGIYHLQTIIKAL